jgi:hypothetical protein
MDIVCIIYCDMPMGLAAWEVKPPTRSMPDRPSSLTALRPKPNPSPSSRSARVGAWPPGPAHVRERELCPINLVAV